MQSTQYYLITMCKMAGRAGLCLVRWRAGVCCSSADEAGLVLELGKARCRVMSLLRICKTGVQGSGAKVRRTICLAF